MTSETVAWLRAGNKATMHLAHAIFGCCVVDGGGFPSVREPNEFRIASLPAGELVVEHLETKCLITIPDTAVLHAHRSSETGHGVLRLLQPVEDFG